MINTTKNDPANKRPVELPEDEESLEELFADELADEENMEDAEDGEEALSGDNAGLETDDDMLEASHEVGLRTDEDYENPQPLNIAEDIEKAERAHLGINNVDEE